MPTATPVTLTVPPVPQDAPWPLVVLGIPAASIVVFGTPAPQGSKSGFAVRAKNQATGAMEYTGRVSMKESSANVKPWRAAVTSVALPYARRPGFLQLDGPLIADMVFTMARPKALPRWNVWPAVIPDLSKLLRSTEDALTGNIWKDDGRVVSYRRLEKVYVGSDDPDALHAPGAVIRVWRLPEQMMEERRGLTSVRSS